MAAAYGVEPVVAALLDAGADARCRNSLSWTPLHEACHRGFEPIVRRLLAAPGAAADLGHVPDGDAARRFPFARPPPQSCLGEAARCGFKDIAVLLLEAGAPKDLANGIGWTPLHEAAFYNHVDVVRSLLVYGADATLRDAQDALAYHVASLGSVRDVLEEMGGEQGRTRVIQRRFNVGVPRARIPEKNLHASRALREMIARPKISRNEWKTTEI